MDDINNAFLAINDGLLGQVRKEWPGTKYGRGMKGKRFLENYFREEIPKRRKGDGVDTFSYLCRETDENGNYYSDLDIIAHTAFLLFAAHDTTTSALNHIMYYTAVNPQWQEKMREESVALGKAYLEYDDLDGMEVIDRVFHEAQRLRPSVPLMTRRTIHDGEIEGVRIPANTIVFIPNISHHMDPKYWTNPQSFDPDRFLPERAEHKNHSFCYTPFGGGGHKCLGMHFAVMLSKTFMHQLLLKYDYSLPAGFKYSAEWFPLPKPRKLPVNFTKR
jgi:cytochrome P450